MRKLLVIGFIFISTAEGSREEECISSNFQETIHSVSTGIHESRFSVD